MYVRKIYKDHKRQLSYIRGAEIQTIMTLSRLTHRYHTSYTTYTLPRLLWLSWLLCELVAPEHTLVVDVRVVYYHRVGDVSGTLVSNHTLHLPATVTSCGRRCLSVGCTGFSLAKDRDRQCILATDAVDLPVGVWTVYKQTGESR